MSRKKTVLTGPETTSMNQVRIDKLIANMFFLKARLIRRKMVDTGNNSVTKIHYLLQRQKYFTVISQKTDCFFCPQVYREL